jgi:probable F420-dependent oxidoreductase
VQTDTPSRTAQTDAPQARGRGRPLKVGFQLPEVEREVRWPELLEIARLGEDIGFDSVWTGDHLLYRSAALGSRGPWEAWTALAGLAAATTRIALGPLVACTSFHNPTMLAKMAATVDEISGGRLILGLGAGWNETEYRAFGFPFDRRISRFEEAFTIVRTLLREGRIDFAGEFYQARDCELLPRPARPGGPPLMIGSKGERMLRIALPHVDSWNAWFTDTGNAPTGVPPLRTLVDDACRAVGRDPAQVERTVAVHVRMIGGRGRQQVDAEAVAAPLEGSAEEIAETLRAYAREGIAHVQLVVDPITTAGLEALAPVLELLDRGT